MSDIIALKKDHNQIEYAALIARSNLIPESFRNQPHNVLIAFELAERLGVSFLAVMQNYYVLRGKPALSSSFAIALANARAFEKPIAYEVAGEGETLAVSAKAVLKGGVAASAVCTYKMAEKAKWTVNPSWTFMPEQMLKYRAAMMLIRSTCPEVIHGLSTDVEVDQPSQTTSLEKFNESIECQSQGQASSIGA